MKFRYYFHRCCLYFSCWSKKGYSIFAGLGREVRISRLALPMYENVLLKSSSHGIIINTDGVAEITSWEKLQQEGWMINEKQRGEVYSFVQFNDKNRKGI